MIKRPKGTLDILPEEVAKWRFVQDKFRDICRRFDYKEIRTPVFEYTELFQRGVAVFRYAGCDNRHAAALCLTLL